MNFTKKLIGFTLVNALVFIIANLYFPDAVVFGNIIIPYWQAVLSAAFGVTLFHIIFEPIAEDLKMTFHKHNWPTVYFVVNTGAIYLLARTPVSKGVGMGIINFFVAIVLGAAVTAVQYAFWKTMLKK